MKFLKGNQHTLERPCRVSEGHGYARNAARNSYIRHPIGETPNKSPRHPQSRLLPVSLDSELTHDTTAETCQIGSMMRQLSLGPNRNVRSHLVHCLPRPPAASSRPPSQLISAFENRSLGARRVV